jgi:hypothetical protein
MLNHAGVPEDMGPWRGQIHLADCRAPHSSALQGGGQESKSSNFGWCLQVRHSQATGSLQQTSNLDFPEFCATLKL